VVRLIDRLRVVGRWGGFLSIAAAVALLPVVGFADDPCTKLPDLWLPPDGTPGLAGGGISVQITTGDVCQGDEVTITVTIDNLSCGDAGPFDVTVTYDGTTKLIGTQRVDGLPGCEYTVLTFVWDTDGVSPGDHDITACADTGSEVIELNEGNNCLTIETDLWVRPNEPLIEVEKVAIDTDGGVVYPGDTIRYEAVLRNEGCADLEDGPDHEFTDMLPAGVTPTTYVTATSGTAAFEGNEVVWDGGIPAGGAVTIKYRVTVDAQVEIGTEICNQGIAQWDGDGDGTYEGTEPSDDPGTPADDDPTCFTVEEEPDGPAPMSGTIDAPTLSEWGMIALACLFAIAFCWRLIRRRAIAA
jgi:uncharacterized repeat protein (TIGR01451 family)